MAEIIYRARWQDAPPSEIADLMQYLFEKTWNKYRLSAGRRACPCPVHPCPGRPDPRASAAPYNCKRSIREMSTNMAAKAACIVCTIDELIDACERRDDLRAFRQNLILGWLKQGNQQMELLGAISVYIVEYGFTDRVVNVIQEALTDPHFNGFDLVNAVHTLR